MIKTNVKNENTDQNEKDDEKLSEEQGSPTVKMDHQKPKTSQPIIKEESKQTEEKEEFEDKAKKLPPNLDTKTIMKNYDISIDNIKDIMAPQTVIGSIPELAKLFDMTEVQPLVRFTNSTEHMLSIYPGAEAMLDPNYEMSPIVNSGSLELAKLMMPRYKSGMTRCAYLGMRCNDKQFPFSINPFSDLLIGDVNSKVFNEMRSTSFMVPVQGSAASSFIVSTEKSVHEIFATCIYLLLGCMNSYGRSYYFVPNSINQTNGFQQDYHSDIVTSENITYDFPHTVEVIDNENFYLIKGAQVSIADTNAIIAASYCQNIPRVEPEYQHNLNLIPILHPLMLARDTLALQTADVVRTYGIFFTQTSGSRKYTEYAVMNRCIVSSLIHRNYHTWLTSMNVDVDKLIALYQSSCPSPYDDFNRQYVNFDVLKMYEFQLYANNTDTVLDSFSFFPHTDAYMNSYLYGFKSNVSLSSLYMSIFEKIRSHLTDNFQFMSRTEAMSPLNSADEVAWNSSTTTIQAILNLGHEPSSDLLAQYVTYDLMSPFVDIPTTLIQLKKRHEDKKPLFMLDLVSLVIEKYLFFNLYLRNKAVWMNKVIAFLVAYFPVEYSNFLSSKGVCTILQEDGSRVLCYSVAMGSRSKLTPIVAWSLESDKIKTEFASKGEVVATILEHLLLRTDKLGIYRTFTSPYRVYGKRTVRLPGHTYTSSGEDVSSYPMSLLIKQVLASSENFKIGFQTSIVKSMNSAMSKFRTVLDDAANSFGAWFHEVYCPLYTKIARDPRLVISDTDNGGFFVPYSERLGYYDDINEVITNTNRASGAVLGAPNYEKQVTAPNKYGVAILLPIPDHTAFGNQITSMVRNMLFIAVSPCATYQGLTRKINGNFDFMVYLPLFVNTQVNDDIKAYTTLLLKHHQMAETEYLTSQIARSKLELPDQITIYLRRNNLISEYAAAACASVMSMLGRPKDVITSGNSAFDSSFTDPRMYSGRLCTLTPLNAITARHPVLEGSLRSFVLKNFNILVDRVFGNTGFRRLNQGYSISRIPIHGSLYYTSKHMVPQVVFKFHSNPKLIFDDNNNSIQCRTIMLSFGNIDQLFQVPGPEGMGHILTQFCATYNLPYGAVFGVNEATVLDENQIAFLSHGINNWRLVVIYYSGPEYPVYSITTDYALYTLMAGEISTGVLRQIMQEKSYTIKAVPRYDTQIQFNTMRQDLKSVHILPLTMTAPVIIYDNLHDPINGVINIDEFNPAISRIPNEFMYSCVIDDETQDMVTTRPNSLQTVCKLYKVFPRTRIHLVRDLLTG